jgi:hypothetical protein
MSIPIPCSIGSSNDPGGWPKVVGLFYLPYGPAFIVAPLMTYFIHQTIKAGRHKSSRRWRFSVLGRQMAEENIKASPAASPLGKWMNDTKSRFSLSSQSRQKKKKAKGKATATEKQVFWQSVWYVSGILHVLFLLFGYVCIGRLYNGIVLVLYHPVDLDANTRLLQQSRVLSLVDGKTSETSGFWSDVC